MSDLIGKTLRLPKWVWDELEGYRKHIGAATVAEAIRRLVVDGVRAPRKPEEEAIGSMVDEITKLAAAKRGALRAAKRRRP